MRVDALSAAMRGFFVIDFLALRCLSTDDFAWVVADLGDCEVSE